MLVLIFTLFACLLEDDSLDDVDILTLVVPNRDIGIGGEGL